MEQWYVTQTLRGKLFFLLLSAVSLGGCGIWYMHFTGTNALKMRLDDGPFLTVDFEASMTILSLLFPIVGVFIGLKIASNDPFSLEIEQLRHKNIFARGLQDMSLESMVKKRGQVAKKLKFIALFSRLGRIAIGGLFVAIGVLGMHYPGMMAQRLTFWPQYESLRIGSAMVMGVAVCGTHYVGMSAATYAHLEEDYGNTARFLFPGVGEAEITSRGSLLACYWLSAFTVVMSMRKTIHQSSEVSQKANSARTQRAVTPRNSSSVKR
uniref:MHYT domain-containing protein n=1 Tax=Globisporangium ultimum (strain ATCC 200006 / CBS 805.95 / DAOM BR144) TaxID=431595 RepID=K3WIQ3_GLOUD